MAHQIPGELCNPGEAKAKEKQVNERIAKEAENAGFERKAKRNYEIRNYVRNYA